MTSYCQLESFGTRIFWWVDTEERYRYRYDGKADPVYYMDPRDAELDWNHFQSFPALNQTIMFNQMKMDCI